MQHRQLRKTGLVIKVVIWSTHNYIIRIHFLWRQVIPTPTLQIRKHRPKKLHNEHKVRVSSQLKKTTRAVLLRTPVPPCQLLSLFLTLSPHTELPWCVLTTHRAPIPAGEGTLSSAITELPPLWQLHWQNLILKGQRCFLPHKMTRCSGWSDTLSVLEQKNDFPRDFHP